MEEQDVNTSHSHSYIKLLKTNRELLVTHIHNTQCLLDNLLENGYFLAEDVEIVCACPTQPGKVRNLLDLVQSKGEEVSEFFLYVLQQLTDAYVDLQPWLLEIGFSASQLIQSKTIINTDPVSRYTQQLRHLGGCDSRFLPSYAQDCERELPLEEVYEDPVLELLGPDDESMGPLSGPAWLLDPEPRVLGGQGEAVLVVGDAGAGKSALLQRLQALWAAGRLGVELRFFFLFRCRALGGMGAALRLQDLLFRHCCFPEHGTEEIFAFLLRFPHLALLAFDGLDELPADFDPSRAPDSCSPWEPAPPMALLAALLRGRLLAGTRKLLTARTGTQLPRALLRAKVRLRGFGPLQLHNYARRVVPGRAARERLLQQLDAHPGLGGLCAVPLFCGLVFRCCAGLCDALEGPGRVLTLTDVFLRVTEVHLRRAQPRSLVQLPARSSAETLRAGWHALRALGRVALCGTQRGRFVFGPDEVRASELREGGAPLLPLGFLRALPALGPEPGHQAFEFLHLTLQAFFAAFFLVVDDGVGTRELLRFLGTGAGAGDGDTDGDRDGDLDTVVSSCHPCLPARCLRDCRPTGPEPSSSKDHLQFTNLFLCGLLAKARQRLLQTLVPVAALRRKRRALCTHLLARLRAHLRGLPRLRHGGFRQVQAMPTFLWMLRCLYETQSHKVGWRAARGLRANYLKLAFCNACPADCSSLAFVLRHLPTRLALDLDNNNLNDFGVRELQPCFSHLTVLRLSVNHITDTGVKVLSEELTKYKIVTYLGLYNNQITDIGARYVARILDECGSLTHLKLNAHDSPPLYRLGKNKITSEGGKCLALAMKNSTSICDIGMWGNQIGDEGAAAFAEALRDHPSLNNLSLAFNGISTEGGKSLAQALKQNTSLEIFWLTQNELNDEVAESFAEMLKVNQKLKHLWLIQNQITAKGTALLAEALQKNSSLTELCLNGNLIKPEEAKVFEDEKRLFF
ncbi:nucleotide-binding oligomerization domain-containing protein 1 isoform X2 [Perognathus longimembris pacificus]|uniref:nucleotide-binding oligomerization domain-containing protein 1 isoform X2 n=1 Tax=Perognathus longimembris pacificus TaxID=214514 RepID=UPI002018B339|nr:nucleotide-binding oligomerization domain-containing protein 1 isoform X2 [Perognathus longimembris pacificus]